MKVGRCSIMNGGGDGGDGGESESGDCVVVIVVTEIDGGGWRGRSGGVSRN